ncbi:hypothetical protein [Bdellovibrio sp. BCCA]|uniref:hypothetical protein n=1 Tax=Bdellovibrio sp. BCCA TaxID=3136281 RepID=UPI0030F34F66
MRWQKVFFFLILGLQAATHQWSAAPEQLIARAPQSVAPAPASVGVYYFVTGTEGCPKEIEWSAECGGFTLRPTDEGDTQKFCNINKGSKIVHEKVEHGKKKILTYVSRKDNVIRKMETTLFSNEETAVTLQQEDTVIIDETGKFLWEHSQNRKGFSCLYSR